MSRVAVVTGAARGIGAAVVNGLAGAGWQVLAVDRAGDDPRLPYPMGSESDLHAVVDGALAHAPGTQGVGRETVVAHVADAADAEAMDAAVRVVEDRFGGLDAMVAAAGIIAGGVPLWEMPPEQIAAVIEVDLGGVVQSARAAVPALLRRPAPRSGRFITVASAASTRGLPGLAVYGAAKAGVAGLVRGLAVDLADSGVTANAVSPGSTAGAMLDESARLYGMDGPESFAAQHPIGRLLAPEEVAALVIWLAGPESGGLTGAVIPVDGGLSL